MNQKCAVIFGGTGFIGLHFTRFLLEKAGFTRVVLADIKPPERHIAHEFVKDYLASGKVSYTYCDVREPIQCSIVPNGTKVDMIANFAAVHREPGHLPHEYFATNLPGATHVCRYAEEIGCEDILFTSSISPYGPCEVPKSEADTPCPETAYGSSKLAAELIHTGWRNRDHAKRRLLIVRPGVVFGPGEGGNVSRLVKILSRGFFVFAGNEETRKAGIYVKELCHAMWWMHERMAFKQQGIETVNMTMNPGPSMEEYVDAIQKVTGRKAFVPSIPAWALLKIAKLVETVFGPFGLFASVNVVRVRKLIRSNNILPKVLEREAYPYVYTLKTALQDWKRDLPSEWAPTASEPAPRVKAHHA